MAIKVSVAPKGMGLNDFVAMQEGYFRDQGLDVATANLSPDERSRFTRIVRSQIGN